MSKGRSAASAVFDDALFDPHIQRASEAGAEAARAARKRFEGEGPHCLKVYLPPPAGRFGMVFQVEIVAGRGKASGRAVRDSYRGNSPRHRGQRNRRQAATTSTGQAPERTRS